MVGLMTIYSELEFYEDMDPALTVNLVKFNQYPPTILHAANKRQSDLTEILYFGKYHDGFMFSWNLYKLESKTLVIHYKTLYDQVKADLRRAYAAGNEIGYINRIKEAYTNFMINEIDKHNDLFHQVFNERFKKIVKDRIDILTNICVRDIHTYKMMVRDDRDA